MQSALSDNRDFRERGSQLRSSRNKTGYAATLVADGWVVLSLKGCISDKRKLRKI